MVATAIAVEFLLAGCVGQDDGNRRPGRGEGSGSGSGSGSCQWVEASQDVATIVSTSDLAKLRGSASGCWDYDGNLRLEGSAITSLAELGDLRSVNDLQIANTSLTEWNTPHQVVVYGSLSVTGNTKLANLDKLVVRTWEPTNGPPWTVQHRITNNASLRTLDALASIAEVQGDLEVSDNPALQRLNLPALRRAATVDGAIVRISNNAALASIDLGRVTTLGRLDIIANGQLTSLALPSAGTLGALTLRGNHLLTGLGTAVPLTEINGALTIDDNDALIGLDAFGGLRYVAGVVTVTNNARLASIAPISRLEETGSTITIANNSALSTCLAIEVAGCVWTSGVNITGNQPANNCVCWCSNTDRHIPH